MIKEDSGEISVNESAVEDEEGSDILNFHRKPLIFILFMVFVLSCNFFTHMVRIFRASINPAKLNMVIILNTYIVEAYNVLTTCMVSKAYLIRIFILFWVN